MAVICIDTGRNLGYALIENGSIVRCGTAHNVSDLPDADYAVIEFPRVYPNPTKWRGDPQHIVMVAASAGACAQRYPAHLMIEPRVWNSGADKAHSWRITERRMLPTDARPKNQHERDACGMAVWLLGRACEALDATKARRAQRARRS